MPAVRGLIRGATLASGWRMRWTAARHCRKPSTSRPHDTVRAAAGAAGRRRLRALRLRTRQLPTRDNLHDFFNGLCWLRMPLAKRRLNELQARRSPRRHRRAPRAGARCDHPVRRERRAAGRPAPLWEALRGARLAAPVRRICGRCGRRRALLVFGHALLEKLVSPRKDLTAHVWCAPCPLAAVGDADTWLAGRCTAERWRPSRSRRCRCWASRAGGRRTRTFPFMMTRLVFRPRRR